MRIPTVSVRSTTYTIATTLRGAGYNTAFIGKYLNGYGVQKSLVTGRPSAHYVPAGWTDWEGAVENPGPANGGWWSGGTYNYFNTAFNVNGRIDASHRGEYQTNVLGSKARALVAKYHRSRRPFFMYLSSVAPHFGAPFESDDITPIRRAGEQASKMATPARPDWIKGRFNKVITHAAGLPKNGGPSEADISDKPGSFRNNPEVNIAERAGLLTVTRQRAESVFVLDKEIGRLIAKLKTTGEWKRTVFMFTSDNGYYLGEHRMRTGKILPHEPSLRVPLVVTGPGIARGELRYDPVKTMDITATIADLAGASSKFHTPPDGQSLWSTIRKGDRGWKVPVVYEAIVGKVRPRGTPLTKKAKVLGFTDAITASGVRTARYKFVQYATGATEMYDLMRDPNEMDSVHKDPAYKSVRRQLRALWLKSKDCRRAACAAPMKAGLIATPAEVRAITRHQERATAARYGR